jgi:urea transport system ATP-binding protein
MLNISRLNHYYGASHTLWDLDLEVPRGSCTCLIGRNGVGKTTLLKCIMGLLSAWFKMPRSRVTLHGRHSAIRL